jgi:hypothetical protein
MSFERTILLIGKDAITNFTKLAFGIGCKRIRIAPFAGCRSIDRCLILIYPYQLLIIALGYLQACKPLEKIIILLIYETMGSGCLAPKPLQGDLAPQLIDELHQASPSVSR